MRITSRAALLLTAASAALCLTSAAYSQDRAAPPPAGDMAAHHADHAEWRKAREERRARFLHDILNIRSDQESAFQTFLADMRPPAHEHEDRAEHREGGEAKDAKAAPLTTPERLDKMAAFMAKHTAERQAEFQHRADAIKRFYAALSPEQQRAFDALHAMRGEMHGGERGPGGHPGGGGGEHEHGEAG
jgi:protein CpxP